MSKVNSRDKGKRGELEFAKFLRDHGYEGARRGQQFSGANGDADVVGLPGYHVEVKRVEALNIDKALDQAIDDAREDEIPVVFHRKNKTEWKATLLADDFLKFKKPKKEKK